MMNDSHLRNSQSQDDSISQRLAREIVLLDGRIVKVKIGVPLKLNDRDGNATPMVFNAFDTDNAFHRSIFSCLATTLSTHSLRYNSAVCYAMEKWLSLPTMEGKSLIGIPEINELSEIPASYRPFIVPLLRRVKDMGSSVLTGEVLDFLENTHGWEEKSKGAYFSLITNDPEKGALTEQEIHNVNAALNKSFSLGTIDQDTYTLCWFFIGTGVRPVQARRIRKKHVTIHDHAGFEVTLKIPLAKAELTVADEYWIRRAPTVLAECLINYLNTPGVLEISDDDHLFAANSTRELSLRVMSAFENLDTYSERLGGKIPITPYRFRYTLATRALAQGASDYEVARLLTHRSTSCIQYYRASMPELQKPIREALGKEMGYFARAFQGTAISGLHEATRAGDPDAVISDFMRLMGMPVGACGTRAECHQNAPVACLAGCSHFEPLLSAPWEILMASLVEDQELETEPRIRQINHSAMSAIQQIITIRDTSEEAI
ncbi:tyrosine-type recombinase/integrase [Pseudomonas sp. DSP3-2-2]|uniref:tyrosine-type recombinase/integrase n=1 Tax=unclassified Pseudomonas TaxID=196821 RepID=UPI003CECB7F7